MFVSSSVRDHWTESATKTLWSIRSFGSVANNNFRIAQGLSIAIFEQNLFRASRQTDARNLTREHRARECCRDQCTDEQAAMENLLHPFHSSIILVNSLNR